MKGDGGYLIAPPSLHPNGKRYAWEQSSHPLHVAIAQPPEWLIALLLTNPKQRGPEIGGPSTTDPQAFALGQLFVKAGMLGREIRAGVWRVRCPNAAQHTTGEDYDGSTVLFAPGATQSTGWLHCAHEHCRGAWPTWEDAADAIEQATGVRLDDGRRRARRRATTAVSASEAAEGGDGGDADAIAEPAPPTAEWPDASPADTAPDTDDDNDADDHLTDLGNARLLVRRHGITNALSATGGSHRQCFSNLHPPS